MSADRICKLPPTARPWIERGPGACAFPVAGEGTDIVSCCQPRAVGAYCRAHWKLMTVRRSPAEVRQERRDFIRMARGG